MANRALNDRRDAGPTEKGLTPVGPPSRRPLPSGYLKARKVLFCINRHPPWTRRGYRLRREVVTQRSPGGHIRYLCPPHKQGEGVRG